MIISILLCLSFISVLIGVKIENTNQKLGIGCYAIGTLLWIAAFEVAQVKVIIDLLLK